MEKQKPTKQTRRQHTIPRMMLKRFASNTSGSNVYTWIFRRNRKPTETNIGNAGVETFFYGTSTDGVEASLGNIESRLSLALDEIMNGRDPNIHQQTLRDSVWMFAIRTANLRNKLRDLFVEGLNDSVGRFDISSHVIPDLLEAELDRMLADFMDKLPRIHARALRLSLEKRPALRGKFLQVMKRHLATEGFPEAVLTDLKAALLQLDFRKIVPVSHVQALKKYTESAAAPDWFRPQRWHLLRMSAKSVILGDGAIFAIRNGNDVGHLLRFGRDWSEMYFPVAHDAVLVASHSKQEPSFGFEQINLASAELSYDQFFAAENGESQRRLLSHIGKGTALLTRDELRNAERSVCYGGPAPPSTDEGSV